MTKKFQNLALALTIALLASVVSPQALASRARLMTLGTGDAGMILGGSGNQGSFTVTDRYNVFYNPAYLIDNKDYAIIEKSNYDGVSGSRAQGGLATSLLGTYALAFYFNRVGSIEGTYSQKDNMRPLDVIFASESPDLKWGLSYTYSFFAAQKDKANRDHVVRAGLMISGIEPYVSYKIDGRDREVSPNQKNFGAGAGVRYHFGEWTPFAAFEQIRSIKKTNVWGLGLGRSYHAGEGLEVNYSLSYFRSTNKRQVMPINVSAEGDLTPWFLLRGGLAYHVLDRTGYNYTPDNTYGRIGATIRVSKVNIDWAIGKGVTSLEGSDVDSQTFDIANNFFTSASVSYQW